MLTVLVGAVTIGAYAQEASAPSLAGTPTPTPSPSPSTASPSGSPSPSPSSSTTTSPSSSPTPTVLGQVRTSIYARPRIVRAGSPLHLSGSIRAESECFPPYTVTVQRRPVDSNRYVDVAQVTAGADQSWSYSTAGKYNASYRAFVRTADCAGAASRAAYVLVRARIHVHDTHRCRAPQAIHGWIQPVRSHEVVLLQVRGKRRWKTIGSDGLDSHSRFALSAPLCRVIYRILWPVQDVLNERGRLTFQLR